MSHDERTPEIKRHESPGHESPRHTRPGNYSLRHAFLGFAVLGSSNCPPALGAVDFGSSSLSLSNRERCQVKGSSSEPMFLAHDSMSNQTQADRQRGASARFLKLAYRAAGASSVVAPNTMALVRFGPQSQPAPAGVLSIDVDLAPLVPAPDEVWSSDETVTTGRDGEIRFAHDSHSLFGVIEVKEADFADVRQVAAHAYASIQTFQRKAGSTLLRMWNFLDAVNEGADDLERYRQFCVGRAEALGDARGDYPAATAIGRQHASGTLQVFWIGAKQPGRALENPRQVSAYRYPRTHGPASPSFSRATLAVDGTLLISGTASIVGHTSQHHDNAIAQLNETLLNLDALIEHAHVQRGSADAAAPLLKVYIRNPNDIEMIRARLYERFAPERIIFLTADICRRELLLEIECLLSADGP